MSPFEILGVRQDASVAEIRKAYHALARRWHPDRFAPGPERLWAEDKMIRINQAYAVALGSTPGGQAKKDDPSEAQRLSDVRALMEAGQITAARSALMQIAYRTAEWNYLFGVVLMRLGEYQKAELYFSVAMRQHPENLQYRTAFQSAQAIGQQLAKPSLLARLQDKARRTIAGVR